MSITISILAGGKSSRFGSDKGLFPLNGKPMILWVLETARLISEDVNIVTNNTDYAQFGVPLLPDEVTDSGPLAGIFTALKYNKSSKTLILTCDSPFVSAELLHTIIAQSSEYAITYPSLDNRIYPLTAVYGNSILPIIESQIMKNELRVKDILNLVKTKEVVLESKYLNQLRNINKLEDV